MTSSLFAPPMPNFSPSEGVALKTAQLDVHNCAMEIHNQIREELPETIKRESYPTAILGFTSVIGRLFATAPDQRAAQAAIFGMSQQIANEYRYWRGHRLMIH